MGRRHGEGRDGAGPGALDGRGLAARSADPRPGRGAVSGSAPHSASHSAPRPAPRPVLRQAWSPARVLTPLLPFLLLLLLVLLGLPGLSPARAAESGAASPPVASPAPAPAAVPAVPDLALDGPTPHPALADTPAPAAPSLRLPLRCEPPGCFIQNYFDHDPGPGVRDYACGPLSYDGHTGTDFRVGLDAMQAGTPVFAAAAGRVAATRDGEADESLRDKGAEAVDGREAGNAVVLDHGDGWVTQYNHLKRGSVAVRPGDTVRAGALLGMVGLSGRTEFPHLELEVRKDGKPVGPFVGLDAPRSCGPGPHPLWSAEALAALAYTGGGPVACGFSRAPPDLKGVYQWGEAAAVLSQDAPALVFWGVVYGVRPGDRVVLAITDPHGGVFQQNTTDIRRTQAQFAAFVGRRRPEGKAWAPGEYVGRCLLVRGRDQVLADMTARLEVRPGGKLILSGD